MLAPSLIPHDIILADIRAVLDLDDLERDAAGFFELVLRRLRDEYGLALVEHGPLLAARDLGRAAQDVCDTVKVPTVIVQNSPSHRGNFPIKSGTP